MKVYDVIIVGAGPAGCSAALFLSKHKYDVLLIDKASFPRDKVCGDGVSAGSLGLLEEMGTLKAIEKQYTPWKYDSVILSSPSGTLINGKVPHVEGLRDFGYIIPRKDLDHSLLQYVKKQPTIDVHDDLKVTGLISRQKDMVGVNADGFDFFGQCIVGADGSNSIIAKELELDNKKSNHRAFAVRAYFSNVKGLTNAIEIFYDKSTLPGYGWIFPVGKDRANVGVGLMNRYKSHENIKAMFKQFTTENPVTARHLQDAVIEEDSLKGWPLTLGSYKKRRSCKNVLLTGDAGSFIDPLNGEGIYFALKSGKFAAEAIHRALEKRDGHRASAYYERLWKKEFNFHDFKMGYFFQPFLHNPFFLNLAIGLASKRQKRADLLAGVVARKYKKLNLLKLLF